MALGDSEVASAEPVAGMDLTLGQKGQRGVRGCRLIPMQGQDHVQQGGERRKRQLPQVLGQARGHDMSGAQGREAWERLGLGLRGRSKLGLHPCRPTGREAGNAGGRQHELGTCEQRAAELREKPGGPARVGPGAAACLAVLHLPAGPPSVSPEPCPRSPQSPPPTLNGNMCVPLTFLSKSSVHCLHKMKRHVGILSEETLPTVLPP